MDRPDLLAALAALVNAGRLTADQARALVAAYDDGAPVALSAPVTGEALAALLAAAVAGGARRLAQAVLRALPDAVPSALAAAARAGDAQAVRAVLAVADRLPYSARVRLIDAVRADDLRGAFSREVDRAVRVLQSAPETATFGPGQAGSARRSAGDLARFQRRMRAAYAEDAAALARLGAGGDLGPAQTRRLARLVVDRAAYVDGLAVRLAEDAAGLTARPLSAAQVRAALVRNTGPARALFFEAAAARETADMAFPAVRYLALDEPDTCGPCTSAQANGPYRADGPYPVPSSVCLGGGYCRCELEFYDDPSLYAARPLAA